MSDRLPLRVPARCPILSRNWASSPAPPTPPPAAARLAPSGRLQPEHSRAAQQGPSLRQRKKRQERSSPAPRAYTMPNFLKKLGIVACAADAAATPCQPLQGWRAIRPSTLSKLAARPSVSSVEAVEALAYFKFNRKGVDVKRWYWYLKEEWVVGRKSPGKYAYLSVSM